MLYAKITLKNAEEFRKLLKRASTLSEQLEETLQQINEFELDIEVEKEASAATAAHSKCDSSGKSALGISGSPNN